MMLPLRFDQDGGAQLVSSRSSEEITAMLRRKAEDDELARARERARATTQALLGIIERLIEARSAALETIEGANRTLEDTDRRLDMFSRAVEYLDEVVASTDPQEIDQAVDELEDLLRSDDRFKGRPTFAPIGRLERTLAALEAKGASPDKLARLLGEMERQCVRVEKAVQHDAEKLQRLIANLRRITSAI
ncbi:MAG: hypothetical protein F9K29_22405 [Hyphomicrobiaceae bacterium]|nr:MAG: hypothetical protein F9K29_22405 [Hyphomicrobiaceae bacterium]